MSTGKLLIGILAGAASGILLGILYAPDKGTVTRRKIFSRSEAPVDDSKKRFDEFIESIARKFETAKENNDMDAAKQKDKLYSRMSEIKSDV
jgi:gas vesicle protein